MNYYDAVAVTKLVLGGTLHIIFYSHLKQIQG